MPRIRIDADGRSRPVNLELTNRLAAELRNGRESGQPRIYEEVLPSAQIRVTVIWDEWDKLSFDERTEIILRAYEQAESPDFRNQIALANGLTVPEAHAAGMLPVQIITALRSTVPVTFDECWEAMLAEGASRLYGPGVL
jgi:hypothetical protein